jgi:hypothetical protein
MKPLEASGRHTTDANKPTPSVTTPVFATKPKHAIFCSGEPQNVTEHDAGKLTPSVATPPQDGVFGAD